MPTYLARYHSDIGNINNYDFIFRIKDKVIDKVLYLNQEFRLCNNDTIYNVTNGDTLEGLKITNLNLHNSSDDEPDVFIIADRKHPLILHQTHRRSTTTFITKDVIQQLIKYIIKHDPLLAEWAHQSN